MREVTDSNEMGDKSSNAKGMSPQLIQWQLELQGLNR
jgi:hypothetical protein